MKTKPMPPLDLLNRTFRIDDEGRLIRLASIGGELAGSAAGALTAAGYLSVRVGEYGLYLVHRIIYFMVKGVDPGPARVDHEDGTTTNNRPGNLRLATQSQNGTHRMHLDSRNTSGHRNVSWQKKDRVWRVVLTANQKTVHSTSHRRLEDAVAAASAARTTHFGDFAGV